MEQSQHVKRVNRLVPLGVGIAYVKFSLFMVKHLGSEQDGSDTGSQQEDGSPSNKKTVRQSTDTIRAAELSKAKLEMTELRRTILPRLRGKVAYEKRRYGKSFVESLRALGDASNRMNWLQEIISGLTPLPESEEHWLPSSHMRKGQNAGSIFRPIPRGEEE